MPSEGVNKVWAFSGRRQVPKGPGRTRNVRKVRETKLLAACEVLDNIASCDDVFDYFTESDLECMGDTYMILSKAYQNFRDGKVRELGTVVAVRERVKGLREATKELINDSTMSKEKKNARGIKIAEALETERATLKELEEHVGQDITHAESEINVTKQRLLKRIFDL